MILEGAEKVVLLMFITVVQDIKQIHQIQQKMIQNVFKMDYKAVLMGKLNIIGTSIRLNYYNILVGVVVLVEVELVMEASMLWRPPEVLAVVVDTLVEMDLPLMVVVVEGGHSISIQMEQKHLDGSKMENAKFNI